MRATCAGVHTSVGDMVVLRSRDVAEVLLHLHAGSEFQVLLRPYRQVDINSRDFPRPPFKF